MAIVQGICERVHAPLYDSVKVEPEKQLREEENSGTLKFFINVQNKSKLETNLQSASLLPHYNTFEARAMRVVISDLPPEFPNDVTREDTQDAVDENGNTVDSNGDPTTVENFSSRVQADLELDLATVVDLLRQARAGDGTAAVDLGDEDLVTSVSAGSTALTPDQVTNLVNRGIAIVYSEADLQAVLDEFDERVQPLEEQLDPGNGSGSLIGKIVYNTVTTLYVGEKIMIQMPTWFFPAGAGPYSETAHITTHGTPSPQDTFRFAEPIYIDKQQNFRVEIEIPDADVLKDLQRIYGPFTMWVVLDGYMTRGVQ
jgi:hypothetical protein